MKRIIRYHRWGWAVFAVLLLLVSACSKAIDLRDNEADPHGGQYGYPGGSSRNNDWAIGTVRSQDGMRYIRLDAQTVCLVVNPDEVKDIPDRTRVFLQYRCVVIPSLPDFCTDAILVEWASPLELGEIRSDLKDGEGDPVGVVLDWMTCLEDGFLTLHYAFPTQGTASHGFYLAPGPGENEYRFVHDAQLHQVHAPSHMIEPGLRGHHGPDAHGLLRQDGFDGAHGCPVLIGPGEVVQKVPEGMDPQAGQ